MKTVFEAAIGLCVAVALTACGGGGSDSSSDTGTGSGITTVSTTLDASGGTVNGPDGLTVTVPAGALAAAATITITPSSTGAPPKLPQGSELALAQSKVYELTPHGVSFAQPVTIRIPIDTTKGTPIVYVSDPNTGWYSHQISATGDGYVEIQRTEFSWFYVSIPSPTAQSNLVGTLLLDVNARQGISVGPGDCDEVRGVAVAFCYMAQVAYGSVGPVTMEVLQGRPAKATFSVTSVTRGEPYCQVSQMSLEVLFLGQWWFLSQHPATAKTTTVLEDGSMRFRSDFDAEFTVNYPGSLDLRIRTVCDNAADLRTLDPRLGEGTWKLRVGVKPSYTVGGTVSGLPANGSVKLALNGGTPQTVSANGAFTLSTVLPDANAYSVTLSDAPAGYLCSVGNGSGSIVAANVGNVAVTCEAIPAFHVGGFVSGLPNGASVTLLLNGANGQAVTNSTGIDGDMVNFVLNQTVPTGSTYAVTVGSVSLPSHACSVSGGSGTMGAADNTAALVVTCYPLGPFSIGGNASGLGGGGPYPSVVFSLTSPAGVQSTRTLALTGPGNFSLADVAGGTSYFATVDTAGTAYSCFLANGSGYTSANKTDIGINCN